MSLDINRVIMEATSNLLETIQNADDKGDKPQTSADKNSVQVSADKTSDSKTVPVKSVTETETVLVKPVTETETVPVKPETVTENASVKPETVTENAITDAIKKVKEGAEGVGKKIGGAIEGAEVESDYMSAMSKLKNYALPTAAIAAGLGAVALAKKLRKAKKKAKA